jgi:hypothetical protein
MWSIRNGRVTSLDRTEAESYVPRGVIGDPDVAAPAFAAGSARARLRDRARGRRPWVVETVASPVDGYAPYGIAGPPVKAGDTVATIGLPARCPL